MKIFLTNDNEIPFALSNEFNFPFMMKSDLEDYNLDECDKICSIVNSYSKYTKWSIFKKSDKKIILKTSDVLGNVMYLVIK